MKYLLDTSVWLRAAISPHTIPQNELHFLQNEADDFAISIISVWEVGKKWQHGKLKLPSEYPIWLKQELRTNLRVLDLSHDLVQDAVSLPEFPNSDPADELIVATARLHNRTLVTTDSLLKNYPHARIHYFKPQGN